MNFKILIMVAAIISGTPAISRTISGNILYEMCKNPKLESEYSLCLGYIIGVWEGTVAGASNTYVYLTQDSKDSLTAETLNFYVNQSLRVCLPNEATREQMAAIAIQYLQQNPEIRHHSARLLTLEAYRDAFPCTKE